MYRNKVHRGIFLAHFLATLLAEPKVCAIRNSGIAFQTFAIRFVASLGYPGTGSFRIFEDTDLVFLRFSCPWKRRLPSGFMNFLAFQTVTAVTEATASLRHLR